MASLIGMTGSWLCRRGRSSQRERAQEPSVADISSAYPPAPTCAFSSASSMTLIYGSDACTSSTTSRLRARHAARMWEWRTWRAAIIAWSTVPTAICAARNRFALSAAQNRCGSPSCGCVSHHTS